MRQKIIQILLFILAAVMCYPVLFMITGALMSQKELNGYLGPILAGQNGFARWKLIPNEPNIWSIVNVFLDSPEFFVVFWNSVKIAGGVMIGQLVLGVPAAWGFARYKIPLKKILFTIYIILMLLPFQVLMLPEYLVLSKLNLLDTLWAIILHGVFSTFSVFLMYHFMINIPEAIMESARLDGAGEWAIFRRIGIPLSMPGIASMVVLSFLECWNYVEQPMTFLRDKTKWPLSIYFTDIQLEDAGVVFVAAVITLIPPLFIFCFGQDYLEQGIVASAVKE